MKKTANVVLISCKEAASILCESLIGVGVQAEFESSYRSVLTAAAEGKFDLMYIGNKKLIVKNEKSNNFLEGCYVRGLDN